MRVFYPASIMITTVIYVFSLRGIFIVRRIFIERFLAVWPGMSLAFYIFRVRLAERLWRDRIEWFG